MQINLGDVVAEIPDEIYESFRRDFDCNNAVLTAGNSGLVATCSLDKCITDIKFCKKCRAYNNKIYQDNII